MLAAGAVAASLHAWPIALLMSGVGLLVLTAQGFLAAGLNRVGFALAVSPLATCLATAVLFQGEWWLMPGLLYAYWFGLIGVPAYFVFKRLGWLRPWQVVAEGAVLGAAVSFLLSTHAGLATVLRFSGLGALTAAVFWVFAFIALPVRATKVERR